MSLDKKEFFSVLSERLLDWKDENQDVKILPEIKGFQDDNFTLELSFFKEPDTKTIETNVRSINNIDGSISVKAETTILTPEFSNIELLRESILFLGNYFNYFVEEILPLEEVLRVKKIKIERINDFIWQKGKFTFKNKLMETKIHDFSSFVNFKSF